MKRNLVFILYTAARITLLRPNPFSINVENEISLLTVMIRLVENDFAKKELLNNSGNFRLLFFVLFLPIYDDVAFIIF